MYKGRGTRSKRIRSNVRIGRISSFPGVVALIVTVYTVASGQQQLSAIQPKEYIIIAIGSILVMFVAPAIYFFGVQASNMTTMAYTVLAYPIIVLILELVVGRVKLSSLGIHDLAGFALLVVGYVVIVSKPQPQ